MAAGCSVERAEKKPDAKKEKSTAQLVIDGATGRTAVRAKKKAEATLDRVTKQREEDMAGAIGM